MWFILYFVKHALAIYFFMTAGKNPGYVKADSELTLLADIKKNDTSV